MQVPAHASCGGWLYGRTVTQGVAQGARHRGRERCVAGVVAHGGDALADTLLVSLHIGIDLQVDVNTSRKDLDS